MAYVDRMSLFRKHLTLSAYLVAILLLHGAFMVAFNADFAMPIMGWLK